MPRDTTYGSKRRSAVTANGPMLRNMVVGYDGTAHADDAAALAQALAQVTGAQLTLVNAFYGLPPGFPADQLARDLHRQAERSLQDISHEIPSSVRRQKRLITGRSAARAIYEVAEEVDGDLIVLGSTRAAAEGRVMAGNLAFQVLHGAPCAVAIAPSGLRELPRLAFRHIGVAIDDQEESDVALATAVAIGQASGARLRLIAVVKPVETTLAAQFTGAGREAIGDSLHVSAREALDHAGRDIPDTMEVSRSLLEGPIAPTLVDEAAKAKLDLLVVGSRGFGALRRVWLGSVSRELMQSAPCPLLVVPRRALQAQPAAANSS